MDVSDLVDEKILDLGVELGVNGRRINMQNKSL
jgi:hypothetical protein